MIYVHNIIKMNTSPEADLGIMPNMGLFFCSPCGTFNLDFSRSLCNRSINCNENKIKQIMILK